MRTEDGTVASRAWLHLHWSGVWRSCSCARIQYRSVWKAKLMTASFACSDVFAERGVTHHRQPWFNKAGQRPVHAMPTTHVQTKRKNQRYCAATQERWMIVWPLSSTDCKVQYLLAHLSSAGVDRMQNLASFAYTPAKYIKFLFLIRNKTVRCLGSKS